MPARQSKEAYGGLWPPLPSARALLRPHHPTWGDGTVRGEGRAEPHWPGHSVLCADGGTAASPFPRARPCARRDPLSSSIVSGPRSGILPAPRLAQECLEIRVGGTLRGCGGGRRAQGAVPVWLEQGVSWSPGPAGGTAGARWAVPAWRRSAAVIDPQALGNFLTAQRAGPQRLAALLAAADVATVEEDHLGLPFQAHDAL